jgi:hypothetical protein
MPLKDRLTEDMQAAMKAGVAAEPEPEKLLPVTV